MLDHFRAMFEVQISASLALYRLQDRFRWREQGVNLKCSSQDGYCVNTVTCFLNFSCFIVKRTWRISSDHEIFPHTPQLCSWHLFALSLRHGPGFERIGKPNRYCTADSGTELDTTQRIDGSRSAFAIGFIIWKIADLTINFKSRLFPAE